MLRADDFNRPNVPYTNIGSDIGWYWQASGDGHWSLKDHELYVNNSDPSLQENDQVLYNTRVSLVSGNWSASVDVRCETPTRRVGMVFMVSGGGTNHYQIRLQSGSQQVQILQRGIAGNQTIYSSDTSSSEVFDPGKFYTISVWSTNAHEFNWMVENAGGTKVTDGSFIDSGYTSGYAGIIKSVGDGNTDICRFDNFYVREVTVPSITQPHPRLLINAADVAEIQAAIAGQVEPRYSAWLDLKSRADAWSQNAVTAPYTGRDSSEFHIAARGAGNLASKMALAWLLDGNTDHRDKAKEILLAWARATPLPGTDFDETIRFANSGMDAARAVLGLVYAYDWLYDSLTVGERAEVDAWFRAMLPTFQQGIDRWNTPFQRSATDPRGWVESSNLDTIYFGGQLYQNHLVSHNMGYLMIGYALGDQALVQFAVDSKENPRDYLDLFEGMILMEGDPFVCPADTMDPPPRDGEIADRYRHVQDTGLSYAILSLSQMLVMTETLKLNGLDFYTRVGAYGETMEQPFNFYADFWRLQDASIKGGFYAGETMVSNPWPIALFEVANKNYPGNPGIVALLSSVDRASVDRSGFFGTYFCFPTLTHGVSLVPPRELTDDFDRANTASGLGGTWTSDFLYYMDNDEAETSYTSNTGVMDVAWNAGVSTVSGAGTNFVLSADVRCSTGGRMIGIAFNVQDEDNYYALLVSLGSTSYRIARMSGGTMSWLVNQTDASSTFAPGTDYTMTVTSDAVGTYAFTITEAGSSVVLNPTSTVTDETSPFTGGYAGLFSDGNGGTFNYDHFQLAISDPEPTTTELYASWLTGYNVGGQTDLMDDFDNDGIVNLLEYSLGGNPTQSDAASMLPIARVDAGAFVYVYNRRSDADLRGLIYTVVTNTDLAGPPEGWTTNGVTEVSSEDLGSGFESVTNRVPMDTDGKFIKLRVELAE